MTAEKEILKMRSRRYVSLGVIFAGLLCLSLVQFGSELFSHRAQANQRKGSTAANQSSEDFYFGSYTNQFCRCAWFLSLDLANRRGRLFKRPTVLDLTNVEVSETGRITFRTKMDFGNVIYRFEGDQGPNGITARIDSIGADAETDETPITTDPVLLEKVTLSVQKPQSRDFSAVYSNVRYVEESGDLVGEELILFWHGNEPRGIFLMYEGEQMDPLAISDVSLSGPNLKFRVRTVGGELSYSGTFSGNRLQLRRTDANASADFSRMILFRKGSVRSVFEKSTGSIH